MIDPMPYHVEVGGRIATIYVLGSLGTRAREMLVAQCEALPARVEVLTLHLPEVGFLGESAPHVLRRIRHNWSNTRKGPFRLALAPHESPEPDVAVNYTPAPLPNL